jgi:hypothetical protein
MPGGAGRRPHFKSYQLSRRRKWQFLRTQLREPENRRAMRLARPTQMTMLKCHAYGPCLIPHLWLPLRNWKSYRTTTFDELVEGISRVGFQHGDKRIPSPVPRGFWEAPRISRSKSSHLTTRPRTSAQRSTNT